MILWPIFPRANDLGRFTLGGMTASREAPRVLVVVAHPDDVDINAAGTLRSWVEDGAEVTLLVATSGDAGGVGNVARGDIARVRQHEQRRAADILGFTEVRFLDGYRDGALTVTDDLVKDITRVIRQVRPERLMAMSPERDWSNIAQGHPDHLAIGEATVRAFYPFARNPFAFPELLANEGLDAWTVEEMWLQAPPTPNKIIDITAQLDVKLRAILSHESQFEDADEAAAFLRGRMLEAGVRHGFGDGCAVETFTVVCGRH